MSKKKPELSELAAAVNEESWQWLQDNLPSLAVALQKEVKAGATPDQVRFFIMRETQRPALALRLEQAASYLSTR